MANNSWNLLCMVICAILPPAGISNNSSSDAAVPFACFPLAQIFPLGRVESRRKALNSARCPHLLLELELIQNLNFWGCP